MARSSPFTPHQKVSLGVFLVIGITTFVFGAIHVYTSIHLPFARSKNAMKFKSTEELEKERTELLKVTDTDKDGQNDYDELYVFRTSPFLDDSDSDGIADGIEISQATDPNCPQGKTCREPRISQTTSGADSGIKASSSVTADSPSVSEDAQAAAIIETFGDPSTLTLEKIAVRIDSMSEQELHSFLQRLGIPKDVLEKSGSDTLRTLLKQTMGEVMTVAQKEAGQNGLVSENTTTPSR